MTIRKAVITVAGFGTRFLPATRSIPKMMLPVLDTPALHYAVEEAVGAGIYLITFVLSPGQEAVRRYFERSAALELALERRGETAMLERMKAVSAMAEFSYVTQEEQLGFGHALLTARSLIGQEPFAVLLPDDVIWSETPTIGDMADLFRDRHGPVVAVRRVSEAAIPSLGIIDAVPVDARTYEVAGMVEKPSVAEAPSDLAIVGRYVLTPDVFDALEDTPPGAKGEVQLTDALARMLPAQRAYAYRFPGVHFDVGTPVGLLKASVYAALHRRDESAGLREWLAEAVAESTQSRSAPGASSGAPKIL